MPPQELESYSDGDVLLMGRFFRFDSYILGLEWRSDGSMVGWEGTASECGEVVRSLKSLPNDEIMTSLPTPYLLELNLSKMRLKSRVAEVHPFLGNELSRRRGLHILHFLLVWETDLPSSEEEWAPLSYDGS